MKQYSLDYFLELVEAIVVRSEKAGRLKVMPYEAAMLQRFANSIPGFRRTLKLMGVRPKEARRRYRTKVIQLRRVA